MYEVLIHSILYNTKEVKMIGYIGVEVAGPYPRGNTFYIDPMNEHISIAS